MGGPIARRRRHDLPAGRWVLSDLAQVEDGVLEGDFLFRLNGNPTNGPTIGMEVLIGQKENHLDISRVVRRVVEGFAAQLPPQVQAEVSGDSTGYIADCLALLRSNGVQGLLLVTLMLSIFLNVRLAMGASRSLSPALAHLLRLRRLEARLSNREAVLFGAIFVVLLGMILFNLRMATGLPEGSAGTIFRSSAIRGNLSKALWRYL